MSRIVPAPIPVVIILLVSTLSLLIFAARDAHAGALTFNPSAEACLEDFTTGAECDGSNQAGATSDLRTKFTISAPDSQFGGLVVLIPTAFTVPRSTDIPIGAVTGTLVTSVSLGIINGPCQPFGTVRFTFLNGSIDTTDTIAPRPPGEADVLKPLREDANNNGIPDGADKWPSYLNELFDQIPPQNIRARQVGITIVSETTVVLQFLVFEPGTTLPDPAPALDASLGYPSVTVLQNPEAPPAQGNISDFCTPLTSNNLTFGLTRDNPCTPAPGPAGTGCPYEPPPTCGIGSSGPDKADDDGDGFVNDGCPQEGPTAESGAQCNNNISDDPEDPDVNDGCPQVGSESEAYMPDPDGCDGDSNEASCVVRTNPSSAGTHTITTKAVSQLDFDGDGHENGLDPCWDVANGGWDPRSTDLTNDPDNDGLPNACDPNPGQPSNPTSQACPEGNTGSDEDQDCFANRQDNCPLVVSDGTDSDDDGIGDQCDTVARGTLGPNTTDAENSRVEATITTDITITGQADGPGATPTPTPTPSPEEEAAAKEETKTAILEELGATLKKGERGLGISATADAVELGGSTDLVAVCVEKQNGLEPIVGEDLTFKIDSQPGSDADLDGEAEVTKATDADGSAVVTLNVGTTAGDVVVSANGETCGTDTATITAGTVAGEVTGPSGTDTTGAAGGADTGVGSLAPVASSIPAWAAIASALGGAGLLGSLGAIASRILRRRR